MGWPDEHEHVVAVVAVVDGELTPVKTNYMYVFEFSQALNSPASASALAIAGLDTPGL